MSADINYFRKREQAHQEKMNMSIYSESERIAMILEEQKQMVLDMIDKLYEDFSTDYKLDRGMLERQASKFDVQSFLKDAEKIVKDKDMSYSANYKMRMYDVKQKVSRLELLLNQVNIELLNTNEETTAIMNDILTDVKRQELERQANLFKMNSNHIKVVNKALMRNSIKGTQFSEYWGNDLSELYNQLDIAVKRAVTNGSHPYKLKNDINKMFNTIDSWSKRILITEATRLQSLTQIESFKESGFKYFRFIAEKTACDDCKPHDDKVYPIEDYEKMMAVPPIHPYCRCSLVPATEEEYKEQLEMERKKELEKQKEKEKQSKGKVLDIDKMKDRLKYLENEMEKLENEDWGNLTEEQAEVLYEKYDKETKQLEKDIFKNDFSVLNRDNANRFFNNQSSYLNWKNEIDSDGERLISYYTGSRYTTYNGYLRKNGLYDMYSPASKKSIAEEIKILKNAISGFKPENDFIVYRSENIIREVGKVGQEVVIDKGFMSTSVLKKVANNFSKQGDRTFYTIKVKKGSEVGAYVSEFSSVEIEKEFLIKPSTKFKITDIKTERVNGSDIQYVELEVLE